MGIKTEAQNLFDRYQSVYRQADAKGCAAAFTSDARLFSPFGTALGRQAIEHLHGEWLEEGGESKTLVVLDAGQSGDLGWCLVEFSDDDLSEQGKSLNILQRQADGGWLIQICSLNED